VGPERSKARWRRLRDGDAKHWRLALRNLAGTRDGSVDRHGAGQGATDNHWVHTQNPMGEQGANNQWRQCHNDARAQQHEAMSLDRRDGGRPVCQANGRNETSQSEIDEGLLRRGRESPDCGPAGA
jgi:hypothetical protein